MKKIKSIYWILVVYALCLIGGLIFFDGTGDMGDSIAHFLFAKYAPTHPELYFHHWAKPVFVLLASPFAQFGFNGLKVFNILLSLLNVYFTFRVAEHLKLKHAWLAGLILACMPLNYILTLSSLTEPLFALGTIVSIYLCLKNRHTASAILMSFLPYVRSEGLIILGVMVFYFLFRKNWKILPYFLLGSLAYGVAGYSVHHNLFWVITNIPYAHLSSVYGSGSLFHFVEQLTNVAGIPAYTLVCVGLLVSSGELVRKQVNIDLHLLIYGCFLSFFVAHTLFWYLGIFNSMGLIRVFIGVAPLMAIIALHGFNFIQVAYFKSRYYKFTFMGLMILYLILFPVTPNPSAIQFKKDLMAREEKTLAHQVAKKINELDGLTLPYMYNHYYLSIALHNDRFSRTERIPMVKSELKHLQSGSLIIWDNKMVAETDIEKSELDTMPEIASLATYSATDYGQTIVYAIYRKK